MVIDLWLVRHGQTDWNVQKRIQGWTDIPLNRVGLQQATQIGRSLRNIPFRALYSSDLMRAQMTATIIQGFVGAPLYVDPMLRERQFGALEGQVRSRDVTPRRKHVHSHSDTPASTNAHKGETDEQIRRRSTEFIQTLVDKYTDCNLLCVTHGGWIRAQLEALKIDADYSIQNASLTRLSMIHDQWQVRAINDVRHLTIPVTENHPPHAKMGG